MCHHDNLLENVNKGSAVVKEVVYVVYVLSFWWFWSQKNKIKDKILIMKFS